VERVATVCRIRAKRPLALKCHGQSEPLVSGCRCDVGTLRKACVSRSANELGEAYRGSRSSSGALKARPAGPSLEIGIAMSDDVLKRARLSPRSQAMIILVVVIVVFGTLLVVPKAEHGAQATTIDLAAHNKQSDARFYPTAAQWATLTLRPVELHTFHAELQTEGKIAVDEDRSTPIFSPYAGRVTKLLVAPGDKVDRGQALFVLEAADSVQAESDFIAAVTSVNKARSQLNLAETVERRLHNLYSDNAMPLKDWQQAQVDLTSAQNDLRTAQTNYSAMHNRLRILGKTDQEIDKFQKTGVISPDSTIFAPLSGTIVQRKVGPGQYIGNGSSDPAFVIGDLSTVWLVAFVRESDAPKVKVGQPIRFSVLAYPDRTFETRINYVATAIDPTSRRRVVRATIDNAQGLFNPEMFANVTIFTDDGTGAQAAIPREAIIYEGDTARVWVAANDKGLELRQVRLGLSDGPLVQVLHGLRAGDKVITRGSLFIDRLASQA
jgi:membrane fusion protein, heavy metal efflux system